MNRCFSLAFAFWVLLLAETVISAEDIDPSLRDRFLQAMRQTPWKSEQVSFRAKVVSTRDYQTISTSMRAKFRENNKDPDQAEIESLNCAIRGPLALTTRSNRGIESVRAKNSEYVFQVNRHSTAKAYSLSFIEQLGRSSAIERQIQEAENEARGGPFAGWFLMGEPVAHLVKSPTFQIQRVAAENRDGVDLVRIEFDRKYADPKQRASSYSDAFMVCDPARHWVMTEYGKTSFDGLVVSRSTLTFGQPNDGLPIAQKIAHVISSKDDKGEPLILRQVVTVEMIEDDVPREEFYLSHYGLPEPNFRRGWFGAWVWYLLAGIVCLGMATIIVKRRSVGQA